MTGQTNPYRIAAEVQEISPLVERALTLAYKLQKAQKRDLPDHSTAVRDNEKEILQLLHEAGFEESYHFHYPYFPYHLANCDNFFVRNISVVLIRFSTEFPIPSSDEKYRKSCQNSKLWVIPRGEEILDQIERPWFYRKHLGKPQNNSVAYRQLYRNRVNTLCQEAVPDITDSLLYIARSA